MKSSIKKRTAKLAVLTMIILILFPINMQGASSETKNRTRLEQLKAEKQELNAKLEKLEGDEAGAMEYSRTLVLKQENLEENINETRELIASLDRDILELSRELAAYEAQMEEVLELFYARVKQLYMSGATDQIRTIELLLASEDIYDFNLKREALSLVARQDSKTMESISKYLEDTRVQRESCQVKKEEVSQLKLMLEQDSCELSWLYSDSQSAMTVIEAMKFSTKNQLSENEEESAQLIAELQELMTKRAQRDIEDGTAGPRQYIYEYDILEKARREEPEPEPEPEEFIWPIPGVYQVTQYFGNEGHKGMDIAGDFGTEIVASKSGEVLVANDSDEWGDSWGYYVLLYHDATYSTRYAHLSSLAVEEGAYVSQGQLIGYEGSTGNSTGPHLHFEIYEDGTRIDPSSFIE